MNTNRDPRDLALALAKRSNLKSFKLGAVIADSWGIFAWGWNYISVSGNCLMLSVCAECHAVANANRKRLKGAKIYVACLTRKGNAHLARPCNKCYEILKKVGIKEAVYSLNDGGWKAEPIQ